MPELPDVVVYRECLYPRVVGQPLEKHRLANLFLLRSVDPPPAQIEGKTVRGLRRLGKEWAARREAP
jgi:formamidopyrimidine-DNA glycosylase